MDVWAIQRFPARGHSRKGSKTGWMARGGGNRIGRTAAKSDVVLAKGTRVDFTTTPGRVGHVLTGKNKLEAQPLLAKNLADDSVYLFFKCWPPVLAAASGIAVLNNGAKLALVLGLLKLGAPLNVSTKEAISTAAALCGFLANLGIIVVGYAFSVWANVATVLVCRSLENKEGRRAWAAIGSALHGPLLMSTIQTEFQAAFSKLKFTAKLVLPGILRSIDLALTVPVVVCEGLHGVDALDRSVALMRGHRRSFVTAVAIVLALFTLPFYIADLLFFSEGLEMGLGPRFPYLQLFVHQTRWCNLEWSSVPNARRVKEQE
eukprot:scaffold1639_cov331-Pavlova_lutheri.AAC.16